ncbi:MAG: hypothetical protein JWM27_2527 [Gemmatimonadetes bacterium]|nr:hypothetical protein [Gemmatimonadota bacterium]
MQKFKLDLEQLQVESFTVQTDATLAPGTVRGHQNAGYTLSCTNGWEGCETIGQTCDAMCAQTEIGFSCDYMTCVNDSCGLQFSCDTREHCVSFATCGVVECPF